MTRKTKSMRTPLQTIFLRRLQAEMDKQQLTQRGLSKRVGAPPQMTINDVFNGADPRLETVWKIASALGVSPISLLTESDNVLQFPSYPKNFGLSDKRILLNGRDKRKKRM